MGAALRLWLIHTWRPGFVGYPDSLTYIDAARLWSSGFGFWNPYRPAGYPFFLHVLHGLRGGLAFAIGVQHVMGLATAVLLYLAVSRFTRRAWFGVIPAAVVALSGSQLYLEHAALSETLYTLLVVMSLYCAARSVDGEGWRGAVWLGAAGIFIGLSAAVRPVGAFVAPVLIGWALATRRGLRRRLVYGSVLAVGFCLMLGGYLVEQHSHTGTWGLTRTTGDTLYARVAYFANCRDFTPPAGTRVLCQPTNVPRPEATWYMFDGASPAVRAFGVPADPAHGGPYAWPPDGKLEAFAVAVLTHQPWEYLWSNVQGMIKYVDPDFGTGSMLEWPHDELITELHDPIVERDAAPALAAYYPNHPVVHHDIHALDSYARAAKVEGPLTAVFVVLMLAGFVLSRERRRIAAGLFGWTTTVMLVAPVALLFYGVRYATPAYGPLAAGAAIGLDELIAFTLPRVRGRWRFRTPRSKVPGSGDTR